MARKKMNVEDIKAKRRELQGQRARLKEQLHHVCVYRPNSQDDIERLTRLLSWTRRQIESLRYR